MIIGLCDRWHKLPEEIREMDATGLRYLGILKRGKREEVSADEE
jgi:hypothetical protein